MFRRCAGLAGLLLLLVAGLTPVAQRPAAGQVPPTFTPQLTPAPSPTEVVSPLPPPITRPEDARGIPATTSPLVTPAPFHTATPAPAQWLSNEESFSVPCSVHAHRVFVSVVVNGQPKTFILGSDLLFSMVDTGITQGSGNNPIVLPTVQIGDLRLNGLVVNVNRLSAYAQTYLGTAADGVLGQDLFSRFPVKLDYSGCSVTIFRDSAAARAELARDDTSHAAQPVPVRMVDGLPVLDAKLGSVNAPLAVDTASDADVDVGQTFVAASHVTLASLPIAELRRSSLTGDLMGKTARVRSLSLGPLTVDTPLLGIVSKPMLLPTGAVGLIGASLLDRFVVLFDEPGGALVLTPQASSAPPYDRSGMWLVQRGNAIAIKSVLAGSPAQKAGLRPGDRILAVNGQPPPDLDAARALFAGAPGTTISVTYARYGMKRSASLSLKTLI